VDVVRQRKNSGRARKMALAGAGLAMLVAVLFTLRSPAASASAVDRAGVWTERVRRGDLLRQVPAQGALVPESVQWLSAGVAARVAKIALKPGAQVEPDSVVLTLENTELELAALEAERAEASARTKLVELEVRADGDARAQASLLVGLNADRVDAERHARTAAKLAPEGLVSESERLDLLAKEKSILARVTTEEARREAVVRGHGRAIDAARAELTRISEIAAFRRHQLAELEVRAKVRGVVQDIPLENGQWVAIGTLLAKVAEPGKLKARVKVSEAYVRDLQNGLTMRFENPACGGKIVRIDPAVVGGSVNVEVALDALPAAARPDQRVSGFIEIEKLTNVLYVPRPAGLRDSEPGSVYRLESDRSHATRTPIVLGRGSARDVEVVSGVGEGDEIVVSDVATWDAARVRLK
jgi:HlyD family secretion protein